ncbi:hypothetical protein SAMN04490198_3957 [Pseudomonas palleroniana]|uniref:Uncharacterized protein n=1 Tax=Pseudomonas palleroniana TaxID=191390 RepID=A0A1H5N6Y4_9PSED|nr:hypothetical protein SAMN04490198_3957 [Pseudomonas palleroniana]
MILLCLLTCPSHISASLKPVFISPAETVDNHRHQLLPSPSGPSLRRARQYVEHEETLRADIANCNPRWSWIDNVLENAGLTN